MKLLRAGMTAVTATVVTAALLVGVPGPDDEEAATIDAEPVRHQPCRAVPDSGTTVEGTIVQADGDPELEEAPGEPHTVRGGEPYELSPACRNVISFVQLTDFQLVDEESPARVEPLDTTQQVPGAAPFSAAYRPQESLTTQVVEAMVRQVNDVASPVTGAEPDLAVLTGDNADSQQHNETRWFIDLLDGGTTIDPDSGVPDVECPDPDAGSDYDGPRADGQYYEPDGDTGDGPGYDAIRDFPGLLDQAQEPFAATGLDVPWYTANGNHDSLIQGNSADAYVGPAGPGASGPESTETYNPQFQEVAVGCLKPTQAATTPSPTLLDHLTNPTAARTVPPDPARCFLAKDEPDPSTPAPCDDTSWLLEHFETTGAPVGHGLAEAQDPTGLGRPPVADLNDDLYFSYSPHPAFRFIVLDTVVDSCGSEFCAEGNVDDAQFQWLAGQLEAAAQGRQYAMVFSHHTLLTSRFPSDDPTEAPLHFGSRAGNPATTETLEELYCRHQPTVLAHVSGHTHENEIREIDCSALPQPAPPDVPTEGRLWEISTAAHIDFPGQSRLLEIVDNADGTMALVTTMIDHAGDTVPSTDLAAASAGDPEHLASIAREVAANDPQGDLQARGDADDRNVIIPIDKPPPVPDHPFPDVPAFADSAVAWLAFHDYIDGYPNGTYRPGRHASRAQIARMAWRIHGEPVTPDGDGDFPDVPDWVAPAVDWLAPVMDGYPDGTWKPGRDMTRAQFARMAWRLEGEPGGSPAHGFPDVRPWVDAAVDWISDPAHDPAVMTGYLDGTFRPGDPIDRAELARALLRLYQRAVRTHPPLD